MQLHITTNGRTVVYTGIGGDQGTGDRRYAYKIERDFRNRAPVLPFWARRTGDNRRRLHNLYLEDGITNVEVRPDTYFARK